MSPQLVKGTRGPDDKEADFDEVSRRREVAEKTFMASIRKSMNDPMGAIGGLSPMFAGPLGALMQNNPYYQLSEWAKTIDKSFSLASPLNSGLLPYDLVAPTLLIYPVYTPLRNRIPRPQGQGKSHEAKVLTTVLGSQRNFAVPGQRISMSELNGGSMTTWPNQLPGSGSQTAQDVNIPYKFFGLTEAVSWLAQFSGQGFDDIAALASLVLLQETMLAEERAIISGTGFALSTPSPIVSSTVVTSGVPAGEGLTGVSTDVWVCLTAVNYYGETVASTLSSGIAAANGNVINITLPPLPAGALAFNVYGATASSSPGTAGTWLWYSGVGGQLLTLTGAIPTSGTHPPTADTGTFSTNDYEGMISILTGHATANSIYPSGYQAGFYSTAPAVSGVGSSDVLSIGTVSYALQQVYDGSSSTYFADPAELWAEATDMKNLGLSIAQTSGNVNYDIFINQDQVNNVTAGIAVSQFANPVTRSTMKMTVHPYWPQGQAAGVSYTLPQSQTNVSNVWENVMVQDYVSINWPVIDVTFRYSLFFYGTLFSPAPMYNFLIQGLQKSNTTNAYQ